jgi:hypothetical protein
VEEAAGENSSTESRRSHDHHSVHIQPSTRIACGTALNHHHTSHIPAEPGQRLAKWIFDSTAIDSVVREIRTDSLAHLYESMFASATPVKELQLITCEEDRIGRRYGAVPGLRVISHVRDSMYEKVGGAVVAQTQARMPRSGRLSSGACPKDHAPVVSMTPGGTSLDVRLYRPRAPKRP